MKQMLRAGVEQGFCLRVRLLAILLAAAVFGTLAGRLYYLQITEGAWYAEKAAGQQLRDTVVPAARGQIFSADGKILATNATCWTIRASPREIADADVEKAAAGVAKLLGLDEAKVLEKFSDRASNDCLLRYRVDRETADAVRAFCTENGITGILINQDSKRYYPEGEFLASVLGFTNVDNAGVSGLELEYNTTLTGTNGRVLTAANAWGFTMEQSYATIDEPVEGNTLVLTVDSNIQHYLENALQYAVTEHHVAARAVGIVMNVKTGAVLAMSTTPAYDPNQPRVIYDESTRAYVESLSGEEQAAARQLAQQTQWRNKAVSDLYEPGSVFKLITCSSALDAGVVTPDSSFYCGESINVAGTRFHCANHKRHGAQTLTQALMNSCNQSFIQVGQRLGKDAFCSYFEAFGLRTATGIDLPAEPKKSEYYTADRMGLMIDFGKSAFRAKAAAKGGFRKMDAKMIGTVTVTFQPDGISLAALLEGMIRNADLDRIEGGATP
ncbi:MAG: peptidase [Faecalibacterium sp.]|jgi:stage V sporulation protein D (sporulation-specific penicillin-binding protein)|nr:peptidase [Faecalibacterium sp.]